MSQPAERAASLPRDTSPSWIERVLRGRLLARLAAGIHQGRLIIHDPCGTTVLGRPAAANRDLTVNVRIKDLAFYTHIAIHGSVGAGEAYGEGLWECDDLVGLIRLLIRNRDLLDGMETGLASLAGAALRIWHALRGNTRAGSRRNIAAHYDLGNEFFSTFLSRDLMYSAALWSAEDETLEQASMRKLEAICGKLELRAGQRVVEIGTGWGGFAIHAASRHGCHVTTTTISKAQYALATQRVAAAGLTDRVTVLLRDYRDLEGRYDRLVSIEMIEAVGARYLPAYFAKVGSLLAPEGRALIQAITIEDHRYEQALREVDFIKRHIFPGGFIPSISAMLDAKTRASDLGLVHLEDFGHSYARTLRAWRAAFMTRLPEVRAQGCDERFIRLWEFYFAYCEGGFLERSIGVAQLLFARPGARCSGPRWTV